MRLNTVKPYQRAVKLSKAYKKYNDADIKKLQADMLVVYKKFDELCRKYSIKYFAIGGTLLGAVRHSGYIPWDDDIDLCMLKEDYDKFLKIPKEEFSDYGLYAPEINPGDYYSFVTKFYLKDSRFISDVAAMSGVDYMGIFVEVFVFYNIPDDKKIIKRAERKVKYLKALYSVVACKKIAVLSGGISGKLIHFIKAVIKLCAKILRITPAKVAKAHTDYLSRYDNVDTKTVVGCGDEFHIYKKSAFEDIKRVKFEDTLMPIPVDYEEYLLEVYGKNYMQLPDESKRWNQAAKYIRFIDKSKMKS